MYSEDRLILVTNDDGITAPGISALLEIAQKFGKVIVVAPDKPQSGQGHAITISEPIRLKENHMLGDIEAYECSGTPVDCVKLAKSVLLKNRKIDLCVSGINHGSNAGINIIYSGTMSAAMEASIDGIDSIGFSLTNFSHSADFSAAKHYAEIIIKQVLENGMDKSQLLNVNIPYLTVDEIKGIKVCEQGAANWSEGFLEAKDPRGNNYYWLTGEFLDHNPVNDKTDIWALKNGYVSVVPSWHNLTKFDAIKEFSFLNNEKIRV